jgi:hypothetical protein
MPESIQNQVAESTLVVPAEVIGIWVHQGVAAHVVKYVDVCKRGVLSVCMFNIISLIPA